ncbi:MAG: class I SAM-dependent methyltransferase [Thermodesulfobacteriota bacterium]|nr:class I SAM-dependent methyltransferase [Thermodesulfobacteriota bacterium]
MKQISNLRYQLASIISILAENRFIPKTFLRHRSRDRKKFLQSVIPPGGIGAEIGVQKGFFTHSIIDSIKPSRLHLIDPWYLIGEKWPWAETNKSTCKALQNVIYWFHKELVRGDIILHIGFDQDVLQTFSDNCLDWVYLDTSHSYEDTKHELKLLSRKVKANGIIAGDDWFSNPEHPFFGQCLAIREFVSKSDYKILASSDDDHQWAIIKG